ncbi:MAG: hypothetical protein JXA97_11155 [Anaerolineales bacterium]|nr:hypothetical protein [Anaerolineales bacterium]
MIDGKRMLIAVLLNLGFIIGLAGCSPESDVPGIGVETSGPAIRATTAQDRTIPVDTGPVPANRLTPDHFTYQGAFRLPEAFAWGALGMSYYPGGGSGSGSLFVTGFQGLLDGGGEPCYEGSRGCNAYFGEVTIPVPAAAADWESLPLADFNQDMAVFDGGLVQTVHEAYSFVSGIAYVAGENGGRLYGSLDEWYPEGSFGDDSFPTIWFSHLDGSDAQGMFHVGPEEPPYHGIKMGAYLFTVPQAYADAYLGGRTLVTGRARGTAPPDSEGLTSEGSIAGGSQGPTLFAFSPPEQGQTSGNLDALPMLYYRVRYPGCAGPDIGVGGEPIDCDYPAYSMCDDWTGAAFLQAGDQAAIAIAGLSGATNCYYCGDPVDDSECRTDPLPGECDLTCGESRGYHCGPYTRQVLFYDTEALGQAALGEVDPWSVLPYAVWEPEELYLPNPCCYNMGGMAFDLEGGRLFLIERGLGGDQNAAVVHVWTVSGE